MFFQSDLRNNQDYPPTSQVLWEVTAPHSEVGNRGNKNFLILLLAQALVFSVYLATS